MGFLAEFSGVPFSTKTNISKFQFDLETADEEPLHGYATANSHLLYSFSFFLSFFFFFHMKDFAFSLTLKKQQQLGTGLFRNSHSIFSSYNSLHAFTLFLYIKVISFHLLNIIL